jgi:hypothetical protein
MGSVRIQRVSHEQSIYDCIKILLPQGENVVKLTEDEHLSRLLKREEFPLPFDNKPLIAELELLSRSGDRQLFSVAAPKFDTNRITVVFCEVEDIKAPAIRALKSRVSPDVEIYIGSKSFDYGIFITTDEIAVWVSPAV